MNEALIVSNLVLWVLVILLALVVLALARQIGVLHERVAPAGALMPVGGLSVGEPVPLFELQTIDQQQLAIGGGQSRLKATLVFFLSPECPICRELLPMVLSFGRRESQRLELVLASDGGSVDEHRQYIQRHNLEGHPYLLSTRLGTALGVDKLPFATLIDREGILRSKGLINSREQLDSLLEAMDLGVGSLQEYLAKGSHNGQRTDQPSVQEST